jgi:hypothetical protein
MLKCYFSLFKTSILETSVPSVENSKMAADYWLASRFLVKLTVLVSFLAAGISFLI